MEPQQQHQLPNDDGGSSGGKSSTLLCRQSSTRWTPTTEQIRILKDLYYNNGVRSPSADQIQKISAKLRQYGKIEGKNVFYWFQNHKARERQKKRLTTDMPPMQRSALWRPEESFYSPKYPNSTTTAGAPSSSTCLPGLSSTAAACSQVGNYAYGSLAMEKSFRDCSLSTGYNGGNGSMASNNFSWAEPIYSSVPYPFLDKKVAGFVEEEQEEEEEEEEEQVPEIETLPLFPMHGDQDNKQPPNCYYPTNWYHQYSNGNMVCSRASLELTLNSYGGNSSDN